MWLVFRHFPDSCHRLLHGDRSCWRICGVFFAALLRMDASWRLLCASCYYIAGHGWYLEHGRFLWLSDYFPISKTYKSGLVHRASFSFILWTSFSPTVYQNILFRSSLTVRRVLLPSDSKLPFQEESSFAQFSFSLQHLKFLSCNIVERSRTTLKQIRNRGENIFVCWNFLLKNNEKVSNVSSICSESWAWRWSRSFDVFKKMIFVETERLVVAFEEQVTSWNDEEVAPHKRNVSAWVINVHDYKSCHLWSVLVEVHEVTEHTQVLDHHFANLHDACTFCSTVYSRESWGHHVIHNIHCANVDEAYATVFFGSLRIAQ